ncbi:MAG: Gfo/Idh/MocA family oxidoreductase [Acidobacteriota bacterium]|nr:Gfo/Idh/MocA family oxidoreductase [Acidobacteriota bacterium]
MRRREFLIGSSAAALTAASYARVVGANDRLGMALVGSGRRGREVMKAFLTTGQAELNCIADVFDVQRGRARDFLGVKPTEVVAIEEALSRKDVDAVLIGSPDHLHLSQTLAALKAGKHVYLEKPTSHNFDEGAKFLAAAKQFKNLVIQTGTQQRSGAHYARAKEEFFDKGKLGKVVFARAIWHDFPWQRRKIEPQPKPAGLDWERFLGPAPKVAYDWIRYDSWRYFPDYGGGLLADILTHWADVAQWMMDESRPLNATATGGIYQMKDGRVNPDTVNAVLQYAGGANGTWNLTFESSVLSIRNERPGVFFQGTDGTLEITRGEYVFTPVKGEAQIVKAEGSLEIAHAANFIDAMKTGKRPSADIQTGIEACNPVHLAKAAYWKKKRMKFDVIGKMVIEDT